MLTTQHTLLYQTLSSSAKVSQERITRLCYYCVTTILWCVLNYLLQGCPQELSMQISPLAAKSSTGASLLLVSSSDTASSVPMALSSTQSPIPVTGGTEYSAI